MDSCYQNYNDISHKKPDNKTGKEFKEWEITRSTIKKEAHRLSPPFFRALFIKALELKPTTFLQSAPL